MAPLAPVFQNVTRTSWAVVGAFVALHLGLKIGFFSPLFLEILADPLYDLTRGVVVHGTSASLIGLIAITVFLVTATHLRTSDLGLHFDNLSNGLVVTFFVWAVAQAVVVITGYADGGALYFGPVWAHGMPELLAGLAQSISVTALGEEVIFRGFLVPQVFLLLVAVRKWSWSRCLGMALVSTQLYFAACHIPAAARMGLTTGTAALYLSQVFLAGLLFAGLYVRTNNLYVAVGIHGLINYSGSLFESRVDASFILMMLACILLLSWPYLTRIMDNVFTLEPGMHLWPAPENISGA